MSSVIYWMQVSLDGFVARADVFFFFDKVYYEIYTFANEQARSGHAPVRPVDV